ncbi:MAG: hypothetical protein AAFR81_23225 [Chloroflexota bacterium]
MIDTTTDKGAIVNTYTGDIRPAVWVIGVIVVIHIIVVSLAGIEFDTAFWILNISLFLLYAFFFSIMAFQATRITITVYENGIDWRRNSSHAFTTWDNIAKIGRRNEGDATTYGIFLYQPIQPTVNSALDKRLFSAPVTYISLTPTLRVPTTFAGMDGNLINWDAFAKIDFGQDIVRYAPHLLEKEG